MKWIDSGNLRNWADKRSCQDSLPLLVRKLIRGTSVTIKSIKFPSGDSVLIGGWDGILEVSDETEYLPSGVSLWEFGTSKDPRGKADDDYDKRSKNPLGYDPANSTFIFVTPRLWKNGEEWAEEKKKDRIWKDVRVVNSEILEEWIDTAPTVGAWLAKKENIGNYPSEGIQPTDDFWEEWIAGTKFNLNSEILLGGRGNEKEKIINSIKDPTVIAVQGASREESLAFIISCFKDDPITEEDFFSRSIIVDSIPAFRELTVHDKPLILIPRFEDGGVANRAIQKGHTVIFPIGADSGSSWQNKVVLPKIEREPFVDSLIKTGMAKEFADRYSKESARNITILRRQLEFERTRPEWSLPENVVELVPALIIGRWDESFESDKVAISKIAGCSYESYVKKLTKWLHTSDSPIVKIGNIWRLTSPFDAWTYASIHLTRPDFELLHQSAINVLSEVDPALDLLPEQRHMASIYGKNREFSFWIREGVIQSLILTSIFGDKLEFDLPLKAELWVDRIIAELLDTDKPEMWKSFGGKLPLIAEASPTAFLDAVERSLASDSTPIASLFDEDPGFLSPRSYHTGLLWALEGLAWLPQYLSRASLILSQLSEIDPGGTLSNRPINSLSEIFKSWHYQTLAPFKDRMQVLKLISHKQPGIAWTILVRMLPDVTGGIGLSTNKMRWRMFEVNTERAIICKEIYETHSAVIEMLISIFDFTEEKLAKLITTSVKLSPDDRDKILTFVEQVIKDVEQVEYTAWHSIRNTLSHHRSYPDSDWSLPESELMRLQKIYDSLTPEDEIAQTTWMFDCHSPEFIEGCKHQRGLHAEQEKLILERRVVSLKVIYEKHGLGKIVELADSVKETGILGDTFAHILFDDDEINNLFEVLKSKKPDISFIQGFIFRKYFLNDLNWIKGWFEKLRTNEFSDHTLAKLLVPIVQTQELWDFVESAGDEIIIEYWKNVYPRFYGLTTVEKIYCLKKLIKYKRFFSAVRTCSHSLEEIPSELIVELIKKMGIEKAGEEIIIDGYNLNLLFEEINKRTDIEKATLIQLEWLFLPVLTSYNHKHKSKNLHEELAKNPVFLVEVLKCIYLLEDESKIEEFKNGLTDEDVEDRARQAYKLLDNWKSVPGVDETGKVDYDFLKNWSQQLQKLTSEFTSVDIADIYIGEILAQYPEETGKVWPPDEICKLIETLNSDTVKRNFSAATYNKRSYSVRGAFDGGDIERAKATYFRELALSHRNKYPAVTKIFEKLALGYEEAAKKADEEAERDQLEY